MTFRARERELTALPIEIPRSILDLYFSQREADTREFSSEKADPPLDKNIKTTKDSCWLARVSCQLLYML